MLHPKVRLVDEFRAFFELRGNSLFIRDLFLVLQRMLETCSEIHCNGPELHHSPDHFFILCQKNRELQNQMKTSVPITLGAASFILMLRFFSACDTAARSADQPHCNNLLRCR